MGKECLINSDFPDTGNRECASCKPSIRIAGRPALQDALDAVAKIQSPIEAANFNEMQTPFGSNCEAVVAGGPPCFQHRAEPVSGELLILAGKQGVGNLATSSEAHT